jgi:feruloyl-CoA synthase
MQHEPAKGAGIIGVPMPGVTLKLIPDEDGRMDVRVKAPTVFESYLNNPERTEQAFDDEGFFVSGDAMTFVDPDDMNRGLRFDGRMSEDFKLMTGTWVRAANLRLEVLAALAPLAQDVVLTGEGRAEVGALIVPNRAACEAAGFELVDEDGVVLSAPLQARLAAGLAASEGNGSAGHVARALVMAEPPDMGQGEVTAKGNLNFARMLERRATLVERLYEDDAEGVIHV